MSHTSTPDSASLGLDGRSFAMVSSTASAVDRHAPTVFVYHEGDAGLLWGEYKGDTVTAGRFVGQRTAGQLSIDFAHVTLAGGLVRGSATSRIDRDEQGRVTLTEDFVAPDGAEHVSVCREVVP